MYEDTAGDLISVFKNTSTPGAISFAPKKDYRAGMGCYGIAIADLNNDGKPDLIATNEYDNPGTVSVYVNTSTKDSLSFAEKQTFVVGYSPRRIIACNLNNDNKTDLAVADQGSGAITVLINTSTSNTISFNTQQYATTPGSAPESISCGDLDGDGKNDLVVANNNSTGTVSILKNTSTNSTVSFALQSDLPAMKYPYSTIITDLNGDGKPDIAAASHDSSTAVFIYKNISGSGTVVFDSPVNYSTTSFHENILAGDLNGDNKPDILLQDDFDNTQLFSVLTNKQGLVLAVDFFNLKASKIDNDVLLQWQTASETNTSYFKIQRSSDDVHFNTLNKVNAAGNSASSKNYTYTDVNAASLHADKFYYRLQEIDKDGKSNYSDVQVIDFIKNKSLFTISPNPAKDHISITSSAAVSDAQIIITSANGRTLYSSKHNFTSGEQLNVPVASMASQTLFITINTNNGKQAFKVVKE